MKRGELIRVALAGDYGKPRPALVVQSDRLAKLESVLVCPLTSDDIADGLLRPRIEPTASNGLRLPSQIMVDKVTAIARHRCRGTIGKVDDDMMVRVDEILLFIFGLAD